MKNKMRAACAIAVVLLWAQEVHSRSQGVLIMDELTSLGAILWDGSDEGEFATRWGVPIDNPLAYTTRQAYPARPAIFPSILEWTATPIATRITNMRQNGDQTWSFDLLFAKPWCHPEPLNAFLDVQILVFRIGYVAPAVPGRLMEVKEVDHPGGTITITPDTATVLGTNVDKNAGDVVILAQVQTFNPQDLTLTNRGGQFACGGGCPAGNIDPACTTCNNGGSCCRDPLCAPKPPEICLSCQGGNRDPRYAYEWMVTRAGGDSATTIELQLQCAREVTNNDGGCKNLDEKVAYAIFRKGLAVHNSPTTGEGYYVGALVASPVCTALPGYRVDYSTEFGQPLRLAESCVFGIQDLQGPNPSQARLGEVYPDHFNVMVLEDNCHGTGDISHANAVISMVVIAWNATTPTGKASPTPTLTQSLEATTSVSLSASGTESPTQSITPSRTTIPLCLIFQTTFCMEVDALDDDLKPWLLWLLPLLLCCCCLLFAWCRKRNTPPPPKEDPQNIESAVPDDYEVTIGAKEKAPDLVAVPVQEEKEVLITAKPDTNMTKITARPDNNMTKITARPDDNMTMVSARPVDDNSVFNARSPPSSLSARSPPPPFNDGEVNIRVAKTKNGGHNGPKYSSVPRSDFPSPRSDFTPSLLSTFSSIPRQTVRPSVRPVGSQGPINRPAVPLRPKATSYSGDPRQQRDDPPAPWQENQQLAPLLKKGLLLI